ncbi:MAG: hypothetical protein VX252_01805 [Myxococcota bacterium]|nr:hypothetical protein [Myxococcota bacterium]
MNGLEDPLASSLKTSGRVRAQSVEEALAQSRKHARMALSEVLRSISYLIDAAALGLGAGQNPILDSGWTSLVGAIDETARKLAGVQIHSTQEDRVAEILAALELEISRWEDRAHRDTHAQAVLLAFTGLREMIWEIRGAPGSPPREAGPLKADSRSRTRKPTQNPRSKRIAPTPSARVPG